jgi:hypothetical protein
MARKKRSDSVDISILAAQAAASEGIEPPKHLNVDETARPFWDDIIETRALDRWTPNDLIVAASLARVYRDIEKYAAIVDRVSRLAKTGDGQYNVNAAHKVLSDLIPQAASMARSIQVHARATQGESREQTRVNTVYRSAKQTLERFDDDLLARAH